MPRKLYGDLHRRTRPGRTVGGSHPGSSHPGSGQGKGHGSGNPFGGPIPVAFAFGSAGARSPKVTTFTTITKAVDTSRANNTTVAIDPELQVALVSGGYYLIQLYIIYGSPAGAGVGDLKFSLAEDATVRGAMIGAGWNQGDAIASFITQSQTTGTAVAGAAAANRAFWQEGWYISAGGTLGFYWAQNISDAGAVIVRAGSQLSYLRIA